MTNASVNVCASLLAGVVLSGAFVSVAKANDFEAYGSFEPYASAGGFEAYSYGGNSFEPYTTSGNSFESYAGNSFESYAGNSFEAYGGNSFEAYASNSFEPYTNSFEPYTNNFEPYTTSYATNYATPSYSYASAPSYSSASFGISVGSPQLASYATRGYNSNVGSSYTPQYVSVPTQHRNTSSSCSAPNTCNTTISKPTTITNSGNTTVYSQPAVRTIAQHSTQYVAPIVQHVPVYTVPTPVRTASIPLSSIPYTGLDLGAFGSSIYWVGLAAFSLAAAYLILHFAPLAFAKREVEVTEVVVREEQKEEMFRSVLNLPTAIANPVRDRMEIHAHEGMPRITIARA